MLRNVGIILCMATCISFGALGCAADATPPTTEPGAEPERAPAPAVADKGPSSALPVDDTASRGAVLGTVMASEATRSQTGITVWGTFKQGKTVTTYGFDKDGVVLSHLTVARGEGAREVELSSPGQGRLRLGADGSVLENTLRLTNAHALTAMSADFQATGQDAAYGWFTWARLYVACAIAGGTGGAMIAADFACVEAAVELLAQ